MVTALRNRADSQSASETHVGLDDVIKGFGGVDSLEAAVEPQLDEALHLCPSAFWHVSCRASSSPGCVWRAFRRCIGSSSASIRRAPHDRHRAPQFGPMTELGGGTAQRGKTRASASHQTHSGHRTGSTGGTAARGAPRQPTEPTQRRAYSPNLHHHRCRCPRSLCPMHETGLDRLAPACRRVNRDMAVTCSQSVAASPG